ncbi:MAG: tetratricopeptide repeat protein [Gallionellaceae bacterium]|jgi:tetratricopeptide (TPR) repeat protein
MIRFKRFTQLAALSALLLSFSPSSAADDIQDANKLFKRGLAAQALVKIDTILTSQPKDAQARFLKALILSEQGQTDEAVRMLTALTEDYPALPEPYNNLAVLYASQGQYEKAKVMLEKALRTHPSYATAHENLGDIYAKMASQAYDRALQLDRSKTLPATKLAMLKEMQAPATKIQLASANAPSAPVPAPAVTPAPVVPKPVVVAAVVPAATPIVTAAVDPVIAKPAAARPVSTNNANASADDAVLKALNDWASAWSARSANQYLAMYAIEFKIPNNQTRSSWEKQRRERIAKPQPIVVIVSNAKVTMQDDSHASVSFIQSYRSGALKSTTRKTLDMIKNNGSWQILAERTGG